MLQFMGSQRVGQDWATELTPWDQWQVVTFINDNIISIILVTNYSGESSIEKASLYRENRFEEWVGIYELETKMEEFGWILFILMYAFLSWLHFSQWILSTVWFKVHI